MRYIHLLASRKSIIPRLIKNYLKLFLRKKVMRTVALAMTYNCQCKCRHCSTFFLRDDKKRQLKISDYKQIIDQAISHGAIHFSLTGGEPLLNPEVYDVIKYASLKHSISSLNTNGILLTKKNVKKLKDCGISVIVVSLDGSKPETHDLFRKRKGVFKKAINGIKLSKNADIDVLMSVTMTSNTIDSDEFSNIEKIAGNLGVGLTLCPPIITGKWANSKDDFNAEDIMNFIKSNKKNTSSELAYFGSGCTIGTETIYVSCYGDVMPCDNVHLVFGNVKHEKIGDIWKRMQKYRYFDKKHPYCIASVDREFFNNVLKKINDSGGLMTIDEFDNLIKA